MPSPRFTFLLWQWAQTVLLAVNLAWTTLCLGGFMAQTMTVTSGLLSVLLLVHAIGWAVFGNGQSDGDTAGTSSEKKPGLHVAGLCFVPFLLYAAANVHWISPVRWIGWIDWYNWLELIAVFWIVLNGIREHLAQRVLLGTLMAVALVAVFMASYQRFVNPDWLMLNRIQEKQYMGRASGSFGIPNSLAAFLLLLLPACVAFTLRRQASLVGRVFFGWMALVVGLGVVLTISRGGWLALGVAMTIWPVFAREGSWRRKLFVALAVGVGLLATGVATYFGSATIRERFVQMAHDSGEKSRPILWRVAWHLFQTNPWLGTGGGSFDTKFEKFRPEGFTRQPVWAHNDYLNTLSDYGSVGFVLFFGSVGIVVVRSWRRTRGSRREEGQGAPHLRQRSGDPLDDRLVQQGIAIGLFAFALQLLVDFHFKIPALAMAAATLSGIIVSRRWLISEKRRSPIISWGVVLTVGAVGILVGWAFVPMYRGEAMRFHARETMDRFGELGETADVDARMRIVRTELDQAVAIVPRNAQAWADRSYAAAQWARLHPDQTETLGPQAEADADRAIAFGRECAEFWIRRGVARDLRGDWLQAGDDLTHAISLSPKAVLPWFHYAYHLSLRRSERSLADAFAQFCLRLDPANRDAVRLRQQLATGRNGP